MQETRVENNTAPKPGEGQGGRKGKSDVPPVLRPSSYSIQGDPTTGTIPSLYQLFKCKVRQVDIDTYKAGEGAMEEIQRRDVGVAWGGGAWWGGGGQGEGGQGRGVS